MKQVVKLDGNTLKNLLIDFYSVPDIKALTPDLEALKKDMFELVNNIKGEFDLKETTRKKYRFFISENKHYFAGGHGLYASPINNDKIVWKII